MVPASGGLTLVTLRAGMTAAVSTPSDTWTGVGVPDGQGVAHGQAKSSRTKKLETVQQLDSPLRLWAVMRSAALAVAAILVTSPAALAETASARMNVSVQVLARAVVTVDSTPQVEITAADLARGYVDVAQPLQLRVRTNSRSGCLLQVAKTNETFSAVDLSFGNTSMTVGQESWVARPYIPGGELVSASVRLRLAPGATPGRHPLPLAFSASAL